MMAVLQKKKRNHGSSEKDVFVLALTLSRLSSEAIKLYYLAV
jgi:hypothetical protein